MILRKLLICTTVLLLSLQLTLLFSVQVMATELTILHTNDWQSRFLGFGPNSDFTPYTIKDDQTSGGISRLATKIKQQRQLAGKDNTLLLDAGDYSMGTLFHTTIRETGSELQLFAALGYDAITFGNHDFDFQPAGLAQSINAAIATGARLPAIVISNMQFSEQSSDDDSLEKLWEKEIIKPYLIINKNGLRIGIIGLLGYDAIDVTPNAKPITFLDPIETAKNLAATLKNDKGVDIVLALSHGGVLPDEHSNDKWRGDDLTLLENVPGIDLIVGGHSHTPLPQPLVRGNEESGQRMVVQAGSEGRYLGELTINVEPTKVKLLNYQLHSINDSIAGDMQIQAMIEGFKEQVSSQFLSTSPYTFDQELAETQVDLGRLQHQHILGNLVSDAILKATGADIAINANGAIRDDITTGSNGIQWVSDLFRVVPLGVGMLDNKPGFDLIKVWVTGRDIKSIMEVLLVAHKIKGQSYIPRIAGFKVTYNPLRVIFDQVSDIQIGNEQDGFTSIDLSSSNETLYSMGLNSYVGSFIWLIEKISYGLLDISPKKENGQIIINLADAVYDSDPVKSNVQTLKEWLAFIEFISALPDLDKDGLVELPMEGESRIIGEKSINPIDMFKNSTWIMVVVTFVICILTLTLALIIRAIIIRALHRKSNGS